MRLRRQLASLLLGARVEEERFVVVTYRDGTTATYGYDSDAKSVRDATERVARHDRAAHKVQAIRRFYTVSRQM
jgi:hypothetical protein